MKRVYGRVNESIGRSICGMIFFAALLLAAPQARAEGARRNAAIRSDHQQVRSATRDEDPSG